MLGQNLCRPKHTKTKPYASWYRTYLHLQVPYDTLSYHHMQQHSAKTCQNMHIFATKCPLNQLELDLHISQPIMIHLDHCRSWCNRAFCWHPKGSMAPTHPTIRRSRSFYQWRDALHHARQVAMPKGWGHVVLDVCRYCHMHFKTILNHDVL